MSNAENWAQDARCRTLEEPEERAVFLGPIGMYPGDTPDIEEAKATCLNCPVIDECLADAQARGDFTTIRGGLTGAERRALAYRDPQHPFELVATPQPSPDQYVGAPFSNNETPGVPSLPGDPQLIRHEANFWENLYPETLYEPRRPQLRDQAKRLHDALAIQDINMPDDTEVGEAPWHIHAAGTMGLSRLARLALTAGDWQDTELLAGDLYIDNGAANEPQRTGLVVTSKMLDLLEIPTPTEGQTGWYRSDDLYVKVTAPAQPTSNFRASHHYNPQALDLTGKVSMTARLNRQVWLAPGGEVN